MSKPNTPCTDMLAISKSYIIASQLAWRSQLAEAITSGLISQEFANELTQGAIDDTKALLLDGAIGTRNSVTLKGKIASSMAENIGMQLLAIATEKMEQANGSH